MIKLELTPSRHYIIDEWPLFEQKRIVVKDIKYIKEIKLFNKELDKKKLTF